MSRGRHLPLHTLAVAKAIHDLQHRDDRHRDRKTDNDCIYYGHLTSFLRPELDLRPYQGHAQLSMPN